MAKPGYGYAHQKERAIAIEVMVDGTPCPFCHKPMWKARAKWLDYDHTIPIVFGGIDGPKRLAHRRCNRSRGATTGNRLRGSKQYLNRSSTRSRRYGQSSIPTSGNGIVKSKSAKRNLPKWLRPVLSIHWPSLDIAWHSTSNPLEIA